MLAGAVQINSTDDVASNLERAERLVRTAAARGAKLVVLPEKWTVLGTPEHFAAGAQPLDGPAITRARGWAAELSIDLIAGSFVEQLDDGARANTSVHIAPDGDIRATYRKLHMFDVEVDGVRYAESEHERAGSEITITELADGTKLGMSICYDIRFPELYRALVDRGAQILVIPSAFTLATTRDHWEILVRARAIENQVGAHPPGNRSGGRSLIADPWGLVLAGAADAEAAIVAELDFEAQASIRKRLPALSHRRPEVYA